ncbi:hypothetical protein [Acidisphaera sp. S103]|uniref:hypothetical protein n=1 Tax=Acidisphaera sp. S103 TaxID=1747223 RepID=UPI00131B19E3|nr:hypothetical protein [Acidisphaera sp. S103]
MLGVQALSAYHAAAACWRIGMNLGQPNGNSTRHITTVCSAARTFDTMSRAPERRQAKPLSIPIGRPASRIWDDAPNPTEVILALEETCRADQAPPQTPTPPATPITWTPEQRAAVETLRREKENEGLDIANTESILPGCGMIPTENPTPSRPPTSAAASA